MTDEAEGHVISLAGTVCGHKSKYWEKGEIWPDDGARCPALQTQVFTIHPLGDMSICTIAEWQYLSSKINLRQKNVLMVAPKYK